MADFQQLTKSVQEACFKQLNLDHPNKVKKEDVDNVFKYVLNYYILNTPNIDKDKTFLLRIRARVEYFFDSNIDNDIKSMTPLDILTRIFGEEKIDEAIQKYKEKNPTSNTS